jgi:hypothetical protein
MPLEFNLFLALWIFMQLMFYVICLYGVILAYVTWKDKRNIGFLAIGVFFLLDLFGRTALIVGRFTPPKHVQAEIRVPTVDSAPFADRRQTAHLPLGEMVLLFALYKLSARGKGEVGEAKNRETQHETQLTKV